MVIGIIALLMGILLPTLGRVREKGKTTLCLSNLRQLGQASQAYAHRPARSHRRTGVPQRRQCSWR